MTQDTRTKYYARRKEILWFIITWWKDNTKAPRFRDIADKFGISTSIAFRYVKKLEKEKLLDIHNRVIYPKGMRAFINKALKRFRPTIL